MDGHFALGPAQEGVVWTVTLPSFDTDRGRTDPSFRIDAEMALGKCGILLLCQVKECLDPRQESAEME